MSKIEKKRVELGLSQVELSIMTGIPSETIQDWESGKTECPLYVENLLLFFLDHIFGLNEANKREQA